jgi:hypothetical protein
LGTAQLNQTWTVLFGRPVLVILQVLAMMEWRQYHRRSFNSLAAAI